MKAFAWISEGSAKGKWGESQDDGKPRRCNRAE